MDSITDSYWAPVANGMFYDGVAIDPIQSNPDDKALESGDYKMAIIDTGTSMMALPKELMEKLYKHFDMNLDVPNNYYKCKGKVDEELGSMYIISCACQLVEPFFKDINVMMNGDK
jgi:uncharacterized membrane protein